MTEHKQTPGLFLIHCRLLPPYSETASQFLKWFKLHYRDIASLPADPIKGLITHGVPYLAPDTDPKYGHDDSKMPPYYFTCMLTDCAYLGTGPYVQMSRRLDLENTREMVDGEVAVGKEGMVFDVVDARFAVYELVDTGDKITSPPYQPT
ncbi:hypothetical protein CC78DRAFT_37399 [Lojkania enalia]|uniref:Uncharacterized protein n=1 Tax=Lojkania enalia TaxID=147567 RepID=A0A9P4K144_9PLEO|nr:hypothetical protein CC78DRAFT_37399 [Didymosphaeria enalia]